MREGGFSGPWSELDVSYRLPLQAVSVARRFAETFIPVATRLMPEPSTQEALEVDPCRLRWVGTDVDDIGAALRQEVENLLVTSRAAESGAGLHPADVVVLTDEIDLGRSLVEALRSDGIGVLDTFAVDSRKARSQKLWFFKGQALVKATTIHSFKGWESRALVVGVGRAAHQGARALIYTALTRLRNDPRGSYLTVVSAATELEEFGRDWPDFEVYSAPMTST